MMGFLCVCVHVCMSSAYYVDASLQHDHLCLEALFSPISN